MGNRDIARGLQREEGTVADPGNQELSRRLADVQERLMGYYENLGRDLEFDVEFAQEAEHYALQRLDKLNHNEKIRARDLRINTASISRFRQRTHSNLVKLAEVMRAREIEARLAEEAKLEREKSQLIQVNFEQKPIQEDDLYEALEVLEGAGIVKPDIKEEIDGKRDDFSVTGQGAEAEAEQEEQRQSEA